MRDGDHSDGEDEGGSNDGSKDVVARVSDECLRNMVMFVVYVVYGSHAPLSPRRHTRSFPRSFFDLCVCQIHTPIIRAAELGFTDMVELLVRKARVVVVVVWEEMVVVMVL